MNKTKKVVIIGDSAFAQVAYELFTHDSCYEVVGFSVESAYLKNLTLFGLPIVPFEKLEYFFNSTKVEFYAALVYTQLNRLRFRLYKAAKDKGFCPASYISSNAAVWRNVVLGEHNFIFENNTIQPFVKIGNNVVLWSGNHIGHHSIIEDNCFISSHVVVSGFCSIGCNTFMGVNSTVANNINVGADNWIGPSVTITQDTDDDKLFKLNKSESTRISPLKYFKANNAVD